MYKRMLVLFTLMLAIVPLASVNAQSLNEGFDFCLFLPADDCQMILQSESAMSEVGSFAFDMSLQYDVSMEGGRMGMGDMNFGVEGSGMLAFDVDMLKSYQDMALADPTAYFNEMPAIMESLLTGVEGEAYLNVSLPPMAAMMTGGATEIPLYVLMKDGVYALDVASLQDSLGKKSSGTQWAGVDLNGAFESMMDSFDFPAMGGDTVMPEGMSEFDMAMFQDAITMTRLPDSDVNGTPVAVFEMNIDYGTLMDSTDVADMITSMYSNMGIDQEMIDTMLSALRGAKLVFRQYIGLEDSYNYRMEMNMEFAMDGAMMGDPKMESISFGVELWLEMSNFNVPVDIQLPEDMSVSPLQNLMPRGFGI